MKTPRNLADYTSVEQAAKGLEDFARDLRAHAVEGDRVKWDLNVRMWNDAWIKPSARVVVAGQAVSSLGNNAHPGDRAKEA